MKMVCGFFRILGASFVIHTLLIVARQCACQVFDLPVRTVAVADEKESARNFLIHNFGDRIEHVFDKNNSLIHGIGWCHKCKSRHRVPDVRPTCMIGGYPCQPFSKQRDSGGRTSRTGRAEKHPLFDTVMKGFPEYFSSRRPKSFVLENVVNFSHMKLAGRAGRNVTPLDIIIVECSAMGYSLRALQLDHSAFVAMSRPRIWLLGAPKEAGGDSAVDWAKNKLLEMNTFVRSNFIPKGPLDVIKPELWDETYRVDKMQDRPRPMEGGWRERR